MTIIVGVASPDGVVLASDSRTTSTEGDRYRIRSDTAQKVFAVDRRFGVATCGIAFIGADTIAGVMDRFLAQEDVGAERTIDEFVGALRRFFTDRLCKWLAEIGLSCGGRSCRRAPRRPWKGAQ
jgi:Proteasome subunit